MSIKQRDNFVNNPSNEAMAKKILKEQGNKNPTSEDIGKFLSDEFEKLDKDKMGSDLGRFIGGGLKKIKTALGFKRGGEVKKTKKKIRHAGRLAKRGYGKARK